ncbi:MAG: hypothetical protein ACRDQ5_25485 [Sciscionella sp.]
MSADETASRPVAWWWGTNQPGGTYYAGRVHVVAPNGPARGLCSLPVEDVWQHRPPAPNELCALCCVRAMAASHPTFPAMPPSTQWPAGQHGLAENTWFAQTPNDPAEQTPAEQTIVLPDIRNDSTNP